VKNGIIKVLPIVVGVALGWLLMASLGWMRGLGPLRFAAAGALVLVLLVAFVILVVSANVPADITVVPEPEADISELAPLVRDYESVGFAPVGPPFRAGAAPPALLVALVDRERRAYATVFRTTTVPPKTSFDVVSIFAGGRGGLTTSPSPTGTTLPAAPGQLRQVFPGATPAALAKHHGAALDYLSGRAIPLKPASAEAFISEFKAAIGAQHAHFFANPAFHAIVAIWRSATHLTPHLGPIQEQRLARRQIEHLLTGRRG
jgi:hypothetical protein